MAKILTCGVVLGLAVLAGASRPEADLRICETTIVLVDSETGEQLPGVVRIAREDGSLVELPQLVNRAIGVNNQASLGDWSALPESKVLKLPAEKLTIDALSGIETERASVEVDLSGVAKGAVRVPLVRFWNREQKRLVAGNTHLHVKSLTREDCDRYLLDVPKADDLDVLFLSYLERAGDDQTYISNRYTNDDLKTLTQKSGVIFGNGEEHRHNFGAYSDGYGHVMLLNIKELVQPVSIGPGIMKAGHDGIPLTRGIQQARKDGGTAVWCHNVFGLESEANWLLGRLDAMNIYDGGQRAGFKERFYSLLNVGLKVPFSTGTDWFIYDFSRVYVPMSGEVTVDGWLKQLAAGRSFITNGPLFEFQVENARIGDTLKLDRAGQAMVQARASGRLNFDRLEIVQNGEVLAFAEAKKVDGHFEADMRIPIKVTQPGWLAARIPPPDLSKDSKTVSTEYGRKLYGHTSPIYVEVGGRSGFDPKTAKKMLAKMKAAQAAIAKNGKFQDAQAKASVLDVYGDAAERLQVRVDAE